MSVGQGMFRLMDVATVNGFVTVGCSCDLGPESSSASRHFHRYKLGFRLFQKLTLCQDKNRISMISCNWLCFNRVMSSFFKGAVLRPFILNEMAASFSSQNRHDIGTFCRLHSGEVEVGKSVS